LQAFQNFRLETNFTSPKYIYHKRFFNREARKLFEYALHTSEPNSKWQRNVTRLMYRVYSYAIQNPNQVPMQYRGKKFQFQKCSILIDLRIMESTNYIKIVYSIKLVFRFRCFAATRLIQKCTPARNIH